MHITLSNCSPDCGSDVVLGSAQNSRPELPPGDGSKGKGGNSSSRSSGKGGGGGG